MTRSIIWVLLLCGTATVTSEAQHYFTPVKINADLSMAFRKGYGGGVDWYYHHKSALTAQVSWEQHNNATEKGLFNGDVLANFSVFTLDSIKWVKHGYVHNISTEYIGGERPLPLLPQFVGLSSLTLQLGHKFILGKNMGRWQWSLQPSISFIRHQYFEVKQTFELLDESTRAETSGGTYYYWKVTEVYSHYHERQEMRKFVKWMPGLAYDIGLSRRFGNRWSVEARVSGLYNLQTAYKSPQQAPVRSLQARAHLFVAYSLGKMRCEE